MAQRWVTEEELMQLQNKFEQGGTPEQNPLQQFFEQLPPELQKKIQMLPPEKQQEVLIQLMQRNQQASNQSVEQFPLGGLIGRRRRDDNGFDDFMKNAFYDPSGKLFLNQQSYDRYNQFLYPNQQQQSQQPYSFQIPQINIDINKFKPIFKRNHFAEGGEAGKALVETERDENITVQNGQQPKVEGGYLEQQSHNPVTGQSTFNIPDNKYNNSHEERGNGSDQTGVNMELTEGDVVKSNKTKISVDFKIYGKNFKNKTFKEASDYLSKKETKIQDNFATQIKEGKIDKVSEGALQIMLAKLGKERNELSELQEQVLESKKQKENNILMDDQVAKYGKIVLEVDKAKEGLNVTMDRYLNYMSKGGKVTTASAKKAQNNVYQSFKKFENFADQVLSNPDLSLYDIQQRYRNSGLTPLTTRDNTSYYSPTFKPINKSKIIGDFKSLIAREETGGWSNPYIAIAGVSEKEAAVKSFKELQAKAASSAIGKYQFVWNIHKNDISRVTGVKDPDAFRNNPQAQEKFMDWFRDTQLLPQATQLKQRYQLPLSIEKVMAMIHLEGKAGLEKKIKSGTLKASTMANNFKNASPLDYASNFAEGGKVYADKGNNISAYTQGDRSGLNKADYSTGDLQHIAKTYFPNQTFNSNAELQQTMLDYFIKNFGGYEDYVIPTPKGTKTGAATPGSLVDNIFGDDWSNAIKFFTKPDTSVSVPAPTFKIDPYKNKQVISLPNNEQINIDLPSVNDDTYLDDKDDLNRNKRNSSPSDVDNSEQKEVVKDLANKSDKTSWRDRLNYGMREALPYFRNLMLLGEDTINPVLQQRPYDNPYDNMRTDYNIQSNLNENQRALLTSIADSRGNPSIRNARLTQLAANTQNANNQLYTDKYNKELSLENQKSVGQSEYRNQLSLDNMNLRKVFEKEKLQTIENKRQQDNMAIDNMMNTYLRKAEEDQALKLSLMNTNWDWNKFKQELVNNPEKAKAQFNYLQTMYKMQGGKDDLSKLAPPGYELEQSYKLVKKKAPATE